MKAGNNARIYDWASEEPMAENIIYLSEHRAAGGCDKKKTGRSDVFWNIVFIAACVGVPLVLFLH